ncbi:MAG: hypothetical protein Kow00107_03160 [Planctomycetota bacterium]
MAKLMKLFLVCLLLTVPLACNGCPEDPSKSRQAVEDGNSYRNAKLALSEGSKSYTSGMLLDAAEKFALGIGFANSIKFVTDYPDLPIVKSQLNRMYGLVLMDIWLNADPSTLDIRDAKGRNVKISPDLAMEYVEDAIGLVSTDPYNYFAKGYIYLMNGNPEEAVKWFNNAIGRSNMEPDFYGFRALAHYELATRAVEMSERGPLLKLAQRDCMAAKSVGEKVKRQSYIAYETHVKLYLLMGDKRSAEMVIVEMQELGFNTSKVAELFKRAR